MSQKTGENLWPGAVFKNKSILHQRTRPAPISVFSYPKINLALDILGKDSSGYHKIQTVFHELSAPEYARFHDEIILEPRLDSNITVSSDNPRLPLDYTNTVRKAATLLQQFVLNRGAKARGIKGTLKAPGASIFIKKRILLMSGLGGGASNAVAALKGLAQLWEIECCRGLHKSPACILQKIAKQIGMDCAFFFYGGAAFGEHFGEKITPLPQLPPSIKFEVIDTGVEISSHWAYENIDLKKCGKNTGKTKKLIAAIRGSDARGILENIHNDFEAAVFAAHPELLQKKKSLVPKEFASMVKGWRKFHTVSLKKLGASSAHNDKLGRIMLAGSGGCLVKIIFSSSRRPV